MNVAFARNEYANAKSNALSSKSENFEAVSLALRNLLDSMTALKVAESPEEREPLFEKSLTSIIFCKSVLISKQAVIWPKTCLEFMNSPGKPYWTLY